MNRLRSLTELIYRCHPVRCMPTVIPTGCAPPVQTAPGGIGRKQRSCPNPRWEEPMTVIAASIRVLCSHSRRDNITSHHIPRRIEHGHSRSNNRTSLASPDSCRLQGWRRPLARAQNPSGQRHCPQHAFSLYAHAVFVPYGVFCYPAYRVSVERRNAPRSPALAASGPHGMHRRAHPSHAKAVEEGDALFKAGEWSWEGTGGHAREDNSTTCARQSPLRTTSGLLATPTGRPIVSTRPKSRHLPNIGQALLIVC